MDKRLQKRAVYSHDYRRDATVRPGAAFRSPSPKTNGASLHSEGEKRRRSLNLSRKPPRHQDRINPVDHSVFNLTVRNGDLISIDRNGRVWATDAPVQGRPARGSSDPMIP